MSGSECVRLRRPATNFNLRTQRSHDYEGGFRIHAGPFDMQTSAYRMVLTDELHFSPITFANINLDPTLRRGVETSCRTRSPKPSA